MREVREPAGVRRGGEVERPDPRERVEQPAPQPVGAHRDPDVAPASPVTATSASFRATLRAVELDGARLPAGAFVIAMIGAANRDPARFAEPARFDVARDPNPHLAFGHGIHFCLGAALSRLEASIALDALLGRFAELELVAPDWTPRASFHVHGPAALPVRFLRAG